MFDYYMAYAQRFFNEKDIVLTKLNDITGLMQIMTIPCQHLDVDTKLCKLGDSDKKPDDCVKYPHHWDPAVFSVIRRKDCGFTVVAK